ncbi:3367_t:CDS:10 [Acaulospora colombiana]|uniref:3367_t:CDS:1 n=1 Tax=Acaulospora colombiana TaxID=27376 RepID=A0ACA9JW87_9GLOM|nr:3367_t:CDS:10 [Acaulospora colombiana]
MSRAESDKSSRDRLLLLYRSRAHNTQGNVEDGNSGVNANPTVSTSSATRENASTNVDNLADTSENTDVIQHPLQNPAEVQQRLHENHEEIISSGAVSQNQGNDTNSINQNNNQGDDSIPEVISQSHQPNSQSLSDGIVEEVKVLGDELTSDFTELAQNQNDFSEPPVVADGTHGRYNESVSDVKEIIRSSSDTFELQGQHGGERSNVEKVIQGLEATPESPGVVNKIQGENSTQDITDPLGVIVETRGKDESVVPETINETQRRGEESTSNVPGSSPEPSKVNGKIDSQSDVPTQSTHAFQSPNSVSDPLGAIDETQGRDEESISHVSNSTSEPPGVTEGQGESTPAFPDGIPETPVVTVKVQSEESISVIQSLNNVQFQGEIETNVTQINQDSGGGPKDVDAAENNAAQVDPKDQDISRLPEVAHHEVPPRDGALPPPVGSEIGHSIKPQSPSNNFAPPEVTPHRPSSGENSLVYVVPQKTVETISTTTIVYKTSDNTQLQSSNESLIHGRSDTSKPPVPPRPKASSKNLKPSSNPNIIGGSGGRVSNELAQRNFGQDLHRISSDVSTPPTQVTDPTSLIDRSPDVPTPPLQAANPTFNNDLNYRSASPARNNFNQNLYQKSPVAPTHGQMVGPINNAAPIEQQSITPEQTIKYSDQGIHGRPIFPAQPNVIQDFRQRNVTGSTYAQAVRQNSNVASLARQNVAPTQAIEDLNRTYDGVASQTQPNVSQNSYHQSSVTPTQRDIKGPASSIASMARQDFTPVDSSSRRDYGRSASPAQPIVGHLERRNVGGAPPPVPKRPPKQPKAATTPGNKPTSIRGASSSVPVSPATALGSENPFNDSHTISKNPNESSVRGTRAETPKEEKEDPFMDPESADAYVDSVINTTVDDHTDNSEHNSREMPSSPDDRFDQDSSIDLSLSTNAFINRNKKVERRGDRLSGNRDPFNKTDPRANRVDPTVWASDKTLVNPNEDYSFSSHNKRGSQSVESPTLIDFLDDNTGRGEGKGRRSSREGPRSQDILNNNRDKGNEQIWNNFKEKGFEADLQGVSGSDNGPSNDNETFSNNNRSRVERRGDFSSHDNETYTYNSRSNVERRGDNIRSEVYSHNRPPSSSTKDNYQPWIVKKFKNFNSRNNDSFQTYKITFHVHLPSNIESVGEPVVLGNCDELGNWNAPGVKLERPYRQFPTYWRSQEIEIIVLEDMPEIKYKYAIIKQSLIWRSSVVYEGETELQNRTLVITSNDQYDMWINNAEHYIHTIRDFAFVTVIYSTVNQKNIKDKIMQYQLLRKNHPVHTDSATNIQFLHHCLLEAKTKESRLFLCVLLAYYNIQKNGHYQDKLPPHFPSADLIESLETVQQDTLPSDVLGIMPSVVSMVVQHNIIQKSFAWIRIFKSAHILDPHYSFVESIIRVPYNDIDLDDFLKKWNKHARPYMKRVDERAYSKLARWLINICNTMQTLITVWKDIDVVDPQIQRYFLERVRLNIRQDNASALYNNFKQLPADCQKEASEFFKTRVHELLRYSRSEWNEADLKSIEKLLLENNMFWDKESFLIALENISTSKDFNLLNIFVKQFGLWLKGISYAEHKNPKIPIICKSWFDSILARLNEKFNSSTINSDRFIFKVFEYLSQLYALVGERKTLYDDLSRIANIRVKQCSGSRILSATILISNLHQNVINQFVAIVKAELKQSIVAADAQLMQKIKFICGNEKNKDLNIPNALCEELLCYIMTELQKLFTPPTTLEQLQDFLKSKDFWKLIFNARGQVSRLHAHPHIQQIRVEISKLASVVAEKTITIELLQLILKYDNDELYTFFDFSSTKKRLTGVFVSKSDIATIRKQCRTYENTLTVLRTYYENFCPISKVSDVNEYIANIDNESKRSFQITIKDTLSPDHWEFHKDTIDMSKESYKFAGSQTFANVFDKHIYAETEVLTVENVTKRIMPVVFEEYAKLCIQYKGKDWEKLKCTEATYLWKNVRDVGAEIDFMKEFVRLDKSQKNFVGTLSRLASLPEWIKRLDQLSTIVEIFQLPNGPKNENDWLKKSLQILQDDILTLGKLNSFFDFLNKNVSSIDSEKIWPLIKELSEAGEFLEFLRTIAEHDIKNLINGVDDFNDERLNQEDTVASLIQVQQLLHQLMNKAGNMTIIKFLNELAAINSANPTLASKITLCSSCNMALQNMYKNISNRGEVTKEKIRNAVEKGTYTFRRTETNDEFSVVLTYPKSKPYSLSDLQDLRGRALLIAKPTMRMGASADAEEEQKARARIMEEFVRQVDIVHEIYNVGTKLIQMGHFGYRVYEKKISNDDKMNELVDLLNLLKLESTEWESTVNRAQEDQYYLTFFPARYILAFLDYFTGEEKRTKEDCEVLIHFVNREARMPSRKGDFRISGKNKDHYSVLCEIGAKLKGIFGNIPARTVPLKTKGELVTSDIVLRGKLFVASCNSKLLVPNVIMSVYANHGRCPEPWQVMLCKSSTTMEELSIFIKRCFLASNNGYKDHLFCIANLELLDFELQYNLVNIIRSSREEHKDYLLALICCQEIGVHHHILDQFSQDVIATNGLGVETMKDIYHQLCPYAVCVSSDLSGQGKSEWIKQSSYLRQKVPRGFLISDGVNFSKLVHQLKRFELRQVESLHINIISADNYNDVNMFLFELLTLGFVYSEVDITYLPKTDVFIEVASTIRQQLLNLLPITSCLIRQHLSWDIRNLIISNEIQSPIQVSCHYLDAFDQNRIDENDILFHGEGAVNQCLPPRRCQELVAKYFFNQNADNISSFRFVEVFVNVLADQLVRLSSSSFFRVENLKQMVTEENIRSTLVQKLLDVSKDFATRSVRAKATQLESTEADSTENIKIDVQPWDDSNHLLIFFMSQNPDSICALYRDKNKVDENVKNFMRSQAIDKSKWELEDYNKMTEDALLNRLKCLARKKMKDIVMEPYALSSDNLVKMALILLRARANIPVVVMGEAGCGKTSLIDYLARIIEVKFRALNLHAGVAESKISEFMAEAQGEAEEGEIWLFFDEINTCNHIGLLADLISHRILLGKPIHPNIRLFAACNPYRLRTKSQSQAGLKTKVKMYEEQNMLLYQVKPLPDQLLDYVWDYGILQKRDERKYIQIMTNTLLKDLNHPVLPELLFASQEFIRSIEEPYSVSLRDVKRAIKLIRFFHGSFIDRPKLKSRYYPSEVSGKPNFQMRSIVLALYLCYQSRIYDQEERLNYRKEMARIFKSRRIFIDEDDFSKIISEEQKDYIKRMNLPPNTAENEALLENVLVMIVCILTKIPVFIIGAPGSSKSLAIRLISQSLRGSDSNDRYFRKLPQVYLIPYQGSSSSTSDGILEVFQKANKFQETSTKEFPIISVVLLDEVGLAETSPHNPLKVLHSLLEPSYPADGPTVSVVGISNWRLDNSKSSRALLVQRPKFGVKDLVETAAHLLENKAKKVSIQPLAEAYSEYEQTGQIYPNFHGLRDYYGLVKNLSVTEMTPENIQMALARNFGGTEQNATLCENYFGKVLQKFNQYSHWEYRPIPIPTLISANLNDESARHLMVIGKSDSIVNILTHQLYNEKRYREDALDPVVIMGSQFPDDQQDYSYSVLSRIMMCVEAGRPLILTDLEIIYGALYDLWNQNYIVYGSKDDPRYFTRVALGAYANPMLYVNKTFRCILVLDESKLKEADPPLLNRFEKQKMSIEDALSEEQCGLVKTLKDWVQQMATMIGKNNVTVRHNFTLKDLFIGYDPDETLQSLVISTMHKYKNATEEAILATCKESLVSIASADGIIRATKSAMDTEESLRWKNVYFKSYASRKQYHDHLADYFVNLFLSQSIDDLESLLVIVNTFSNINTDVKGCLEKVMRVQVDKLSTFKTEAQLQNRVKHFWLESNDQMLVLQCDVTTANAGCIKLAKFIIEQYRNEFMRIRKEDTDAKHACIILHIHREQETQFLSFNFMCGWSQVTIETLAPQEKHLSTLLDGPLTNIMKSTYPFEEILKQELLWCLLCMRYPSTENSINHLRTLHSEIIKHSELVECLKERTLIWLEENSPEDWQYEVASNKMLLYPYSSFSAALQARIRTMVRRPVAQMLFVLERLSAIKTFFNIDQPGSERNPLISLWKNMFNDPKIVNIDDLLFVPGPDRYLLPHHLYDLQFPFSYYFIKKIDEFKVTCLAELDRLKQDRENCDDSGDLHPHIENFTYETFKSNIYSLLPYLREPSIEPHLDKYFNDFVTIASVSDGGKNGVELLSLLLRQLLGEEKIRDPVLLHVYWWINSNTILADLQLAQMCPSIVQDFSSRNTNYTFEEFLIQEVTTMMLNKVCGNSIEGINDPQVDQWLREVTKVLTFSGKLMKSRKLPSYQLLRICNELISFKYIPLSNIKEIIRLGQTSDGNEILSKEFVNYVLKVLNGLEKNEKNLIPRRAFIMRCLDIIPLESPVLQNIYQDIFSQDPFPLIGSIISRIFLKEDNENEGAFFALFTEPQRILTISPRLRIINACLKSKKADSLMAALCCDIIQQNYFSVLEIAEMVNYFNPAAKTLIATGIEPLQLISAIAFLKEFVGRLWDTTIDEENFTRPITLNQMMELGHLNGDAIIAQINGYMETDHPLIHSLKIYFLRDLRSRDFSIDDVKRFCQGQQHTLPWLLTFQWDDNNDNRLPFNPYWHLPEYAHVEDSFKQLYSVNDKGPFQPFLQQLPQNIHARIAFLGLIMTRLHVFRASREWGPNETRAAEFLRTVSTMDSLPVIYRQTVDKLILNRHPLLFINSGIDNGTLMVDSVIAHAVALHVSMPPDASPLATLLHKLDACQNRFILACISDVESVLLSAVIANGGQVTRYTCECGSKYVIANCGYAMEAIRCPDCKVRTIGGADHASAAGNRRLDQKPITAIAGNDQAGYIGESPNQSLTHSVRSMPPTSYRILHLFAHILIGASPLTAKTGFLQKNNQIATNAEQYCMGHIQNDWNVLRGILNCSDENLALLLHSILSLMTRNPPPASALGTPNEREDWETNFTRNYVSPQTKSITETITNFRTILDNASAAQGNNANIIESWINQTLTYDDQQQAQFLPRIWRKIGINSFESFRAHYNGNLSQNQKDFPFLAVYFKHESKLSKIKYLWPIVKFVQSLFARLSYRISRKDAQAQTFRDFFNKESETSNIDSVNTLNKAFQEFEEAWNVVIEDVDRYQCHTLEHKPKMNQDRRLIMGLMEPEDDGVYLCAIIEYLVSLQNEFLQEIMVIPPGTCRSLKFLEESLEAKSDDTPARYFVQSMTIDQARKDNIISYKWEDEFDEILEFSERNLGIGKGQDIIYDLQKIEIELSRYLVFEKVHIETLSDSNLYIERFSYHMELFQSSVRILEEIRELIPQEPIPPERASIIRGTSGPHDYMQNQMDTSLDNPSDILSALEILLCFVKRTPGGGGEIEIKEYISKWASLSEISENVRFNNLLNAELKLKHLVGLYELIEEQVANASVRFIPDKYKEKLPQRIKDSLNEIIDYSVPSLQDLLPADASALALKRFMYRFLQGETIKETFPLNVYFSEESLYLWPLSVPQKLIDDRFPDELLVAHAYSAYEFITEQIEENEKEPGDDEKLAYMRQTLDDPALFLSKWGKYLPKDQLSKFEGLRADYEVNWHLNQLQKSTPLSVSRDLHPKARHNKKILNRRYRYLTTRLDNSSYFSDEAMEYREPSLYEDYVGQYIPDEIRYPPFADNVDLVDRMLYDIDQSYINDRLEEEKRLHEEQFEEEEDDEEEMDEIGTKNERRDSETISNSQIHEHSTVMQEPSENSDSGVKDESGTTLEPERPQISDEEKEQLRTDLIDIMREKFISGNDSYFDYDTVDFNEDYDDIKIEEEDIQEPDDMNEVDTGTGILDY